MTHQDDNDTLSTNANGDLWQTRLSIRYLNSCKKAELTAKATATAAATNGLALLPSSSRRVSIIVLSSNFIYSKSPTLLGISSIWVL